MKQKLQDKRKKLIDLKQKIANQIRQSQIQLQRVEGAIAVLNELLEEKRGE